MANFSENFTASDQSLNGYNGWGTSGTSNSSLSIFNDRGQYLSGGFNLKSNKKNIGGTVNLPFDISFVVAPGKGSIGEDRFEHRLMFGANASGSYSYYPTSANEGIHIVVVGSGVQVFDNGSLVKNTASTVSYVQHTIRVIVNSDGSGDIRVDNVSKGTWGARVWSTMPGSYCILAIDCSSSYSLGYFDTISIDYEQSSLPSIKTWNGLTNSSIKTINGLSIANIKNINGLM